MEDCKIKKWDEILYASALKELEEYEKDAHKLINYDFFDEFNSI